MVRDELGRIQKGHTLNPGGRPKIPGPVKDAFAAAAPRAAEVLTQLLESEDRRLALAAAIAILDRVIGKPTQASNDAWHEEPFLPPSPLDGLTTEEFLAFARGECPQCSVDESGATQIIPSLATDRALRELE